MGFGLALLTVSSLVVGSRIIHTQKWDGGFGSVEAVCSIDPEFTCWDSDGKVSSTLADEQLSQNGTLHVYRKPGPTPHLVFLRLAHGSDYTYFQFPDTVTSSGKSEEGRYVMRLVVAVYGKPGVREATLVGQRPIPKPIETPFKVGSVLRVPGHEYVIRGFKEGKVGGYSIPLTTASGRTWTVTCDVRAFAPKKAPPLLFAYDKDGVLIRAVDADGEMRLVEPNLIRQVTGQFGYGQPPTLPVGVSVARLYVAIPANLENPKTIEFTTNINPAKIRFLRYFDTEYQPINFKIPLEPRG